MHVLVLGGTQFVGLALVNEALLRGHQVTVLNRGNRPTPPGATQLVGDRLTPNGHAALQGKTFDAVIDTWALDPIAVKRAVEVLQGNVKHFAYVSTISVYDVTKLDFDKKLTEDAPVVDPTKPGVHPYSANKRGGELAILEGAPHLPLLIARPGLILGPGEGPMRLPWWLWRLRRGGRTLAPGPKDLDLRYVDSRDLAIFLLDGVEKKREGIYNTISKPVITTMGELLEMTNEVTGAKADLVWKSEREILAAGIKPWSELPIWSPPSEKDYAFVYDGDSSKAYEAGLRVRSALETVRDTWKWLETGDDVPPQDSLQVGLSPEKEAALLGPGNDA